MIVEQRTYDFQVGKIPEFMRIYEDTGARALQLRVLGHLVGYYVTELGALNQTVHLWGYTSLDERMRRRAVLFQDRVWREFLAQAGPLILRQESKILLPTPFCPMPEQAGESD